MIDVDNIGIEKDSDIIFVTVAKYKLFMSYGKIGMDAYCLYSHMMFTARLQETNQIKANDVYLRQGLDWGKDRVQKAKALLIDLELIEEIRRRDEEGKFLDKYIRVKTKTTPFEITKIESPCAENPPVDESTCGQTETNALTKKRNASTKKRNAVFTPPTEQEVQTYATTNSLSFNIKKFMKYYTASGWKDKNGKPVKNWKLTAVSWDNGDASSPANKSYQQQLDELYPRSK